MIQNKVFIVLTILVVIIAKNLVEGTVNKQIIKAYEKVNDLLVDKAIGEDPKYMKPIKYFLIEKLEDEKEKSFFMRSKYMIEVLEKLVALANLDDADKCSDKSLNLLIFNDEASEGKARVNWDPDTARQIDKYLRYLFKEHANYCAKVYPKRFEKLFPKIDEKTIEDIDLLLVDVMAERIESEKKFFFEKKNPHYLYEILVNPKSLTAGEYDLILDELSRRMKSNEAITNPQRDVFSLLSKPCEKYMEAMKPNLLGPAAFDQELSKPSPASRKEIAYFHSLAKYNTCAFMTTDTFKIDLMDRFSQRLKRHQPTAD